MNVRDEIYLGHKGGELKMNICGNLVKDFIKEGENFVFGIINDEQKVYSLEKIEKLIKEIGIKEVIDTYFEQIIFKANDGEIYELGYL